MRAAFPASAAHRPGGAPIARRENSAAAARELAGSAGGMLDRSSALTATVRAGILRQAFMCIGMPAQPVAGRAAAAGAADSPPGGGFPWRSLGSPDPHAKAYDCAHF